MNKKIGIHTRFQWAKKADLTYNFVCTQTYWTLLLKWTFKDSNVKVWILLGWVNTESSRGDLLNTIKELLFRAELNSFGF